MGSEASAVDTRLPAQDESIDGRLRRLQEDAARLVEARAAVFGVDLQGHITDWNAVAARLTGFRFEEVVGKHLVDEIITADVRDEVAAVLADAAAGRGGACLEFPLIALDGRTALVQLSAGPRRDEQGEVTGVVCVGHDVTDLREAIACAERSRDDLHRFVDAVAAPLWAVDVRGNVTEWNRRAGLATGSARAEALGRPFASTFVAEDHRRDVARMLQLAAEGQESVTCECQLVDRVGIRRDILLTAAPRRDAEGGVVGVACVGQELTELQALSAGQRSFAEDWSRLIETANAPIFGMSKDGLVTEWNAKAAEISGFAKAETLGKALVETFILEDCREEVSRVLSAALAGNETANFEFPLCSKDGKCVHILLNATSRRDARGQIVGVIGVGQDITELREAMSFSRSVADDLTRLMDTANAPIFGIDTAGCVTEWNRVASKITGYDKRSVLGLPMVENFIHIGHQDRVREVFDRALKGQEVANVELPLCTATGEWREILLNATARRGPNGEILGVVGVGQDITELHAQRREAERIAHDLSQLINTANAAIFGINVQGCVTEWNRKASEISGYSKEEIKGQRLVQSLVAEEQQHQVAYVLLKALGGEEASEFEFPIMTKAGERRDLLVNATAMCSADGLVTGVIGVGQDVTEVKKIAAEHKHIAEDLARLIRSANAPIFGVGIEGEVTEWNDKAAALSGYSREEALGKHLVSTFIREEDREEVSRAIEDALNGIETTHFEFPLIHRDGSEVFVLLNAATRKDAGGRIVGMVGVGQDFTTLRQAITEISSVADDLRRIIEHANAPILGVDTEGNVTEWNRKIVGISEYSKEEMLGKSLLQTFIREEYREEVGRVFAQALEGVETANYEFPLFTKSGRRHEILFNATPRRGAQGQVTGVIGVGQDITKLRAVSQEHQRIADDLSRLIETANAPIFGVDTRGLITEWNRKAEEISGFTKQETCGQSLIKHFIHRVHRRSVQAVLDQALDGQEVGNFELTLYTRSGERRDILISATPRRGLHNEVLGVVCVGQDITQLNQHRQEAERIAHDLSCLIETANAPIFGLDKEMCIEEWNGWVAKKSGFTQEDVRGKKLTNYIAEDFHSVVAGIIEKSCRGVPTSNFEVELMTLNSEKPVCLLLNATPRLGPQGDIVGVLCVGQDITNIKDIELKKSNFMATVSHELKSPLHGIIGLSSTMADSPEVPTAMLRPLQLIHSCATRLLDMVSNIMDVSVLVSDKDLRFSRDQVQLAAIIEEVIVLCRHSIDKRGVPVVKDGVSLINTVTMLPMIEADAHRCTQMLYNLISNACKFTQRGYVQVSARADDAAQTVTITVEDTGIGIAPENLERVFQPFDQEDTSETRHFEGLGLGLSISKEVAVKHGGSLTVDSVQGEGSRFYVTLPYKMRDPVDVDLPEDGPPNSSSAMSVEPYHRELQPVLEEEPLPGQPPYVSRRSLRDRVGAPGSAAHQDTFQGRSFDDGASSPSICTDSHGPVTQDLLEPYVPSPEILLSEWEDLPASKTFTVLSVDDDAVHQELMCQTLRMCNYRVIALLSGGECLRYIESCDALPDVILMDMLMPGLSGIDVVAELRKHHAMAELPIIMVSAKNSTQAVVKGLCMQCNDWIHKPFDRSELVARVRTQLRIKEFALGRSGSSVPCHLLSRILPTQWVAQLAGGCCPAKQVEQIRVDFAERFPDTQAQGKSPRLDADAIAKMASKDPGDPSRWRAAGLLSESRQLLEQSSRDMLEAQSDLLQAQAQREAERQQHLAHRQQLTPPQPSPRLLFPHLPLPGQSPQPQSLPAALPATPLLPPPPMQQRQEALPTAQPPPPQQQQQQQHHLQQLWPQPAPQHCSGGGAPTADQLHTPGAPRWPAGPADSASASLAGAAPWALQAPAPLVEQALLLLPLLQHQNAHLHLQVKQRDRRLHTVQAQLQQQACGMKLLESRCAQAEACIRRLSLDAAFLGATSRGICTASSTPTRTSTRDF